MLQKIEIYNLYDDNLEISQKTEIVTIVYSDGHYKVTTKIYNAFSELISESSNIYNADGSIRS